MPHTALYRKKRPRAFREIVGQPHIVRTLENQLLAKQINHAYLFCGTRGTGKTSAAKILARAINCLAPAGAEPCNTCELCESILKERCLDVAEIDAASNNGVDNIRDLRDEVKYLPTQGRYKVYIVDEVHMLSPNAFNALLKTLEEPPAHVVFILATTDPQKIPATILSRCQRYDFRRISPADIVETLKGYLREESLEFEDSALEYIAYHSDGAMRDALSLLDQSLSMDSGGVSLLNVREMLGAVDRAILFEFTDALANNDSGAIMSIISQAMDEGRDVSQFASDLVRHFRDVLVAGLTETGDFSSEMTLRLKAQSKSIPGGRLMECINAFSETLREMRFAPHMRTAFEVCALKLCMPATLPPTQGEIAVASPSKNQLSAPPADKTALPSKPSAPSDALGEIVSDWGKLCRSLPMPLRSWCGRCGVEAEAGMLKIICDNDATITLIKSKQTIVREALADCFNLTTPPNLAFEVREGYNKGAVEPMRPIEAQREEVKPRIQPNEKLLEADTPNDWASFGQAVVSDEEW
ncbi:MAG: DNA polymerase III subunit gamma/tau [Defluviitaleaceae bacterium]|nr:DNA polymerase III subunit gamma/tau [Defluviitaleaceae bacterium]